MKKKLTPVRKEKVSELIAYQKKLSRNLMWITGVTVVLLVGSFHPIRFIHGLWQKNYSQYGSLPPVATKFSWWIFEKTEIVDSDIVAILFILAIAIFQLYFKNIKLKIVVYFWLLVLAIMLLFLGLLGAPPIYICRF